MPPRRTGRDSLAVFLDALRAFLLREMKQQFGRFRLGYLWAFFEPAATVAVLTLIHAGIAGGNTQIYGQSPILFFVFGAVPFFVFFNCLNRAQGICAAHKGLFNYRQIKPIDILLARGIIEALSVGSVCVVFLLGWSWLGHPLTVENPLLLLHSFAALFLLGLALGLIFEVYGTVHEDLRRVFSIFMRPLFFISGLFFTIDMIPEDYQYLLTWNPVLHAVDFARDSVIPGYSSPASFLYLWGCTLVLVFVGLAAYRRHLNQLI